MRTFERGAAAEASNAMSNARRANSIFRMWSLLVGCGSSGGI
jgi:hypothetical protein